MNEILQHSIQHGAKYNTFVIPIAPLFEDLQMEICNRNINPRCLGTQIGPVTMGVIQKAVDDFGIFRGWDISYDRFDTSTLAFYLNYYDETRLVEQVQEYLTSAMYSILPITIPEWQWFYKLIWGSHLVIFIDTRDLVCRPEEEEPISMSSQIALLSA